MTQPAAVSSLQEKQPGQNPDSIYCLAVIPKQGFAATQKPCEFPLYWISCGVDQDLKQLTTILTEVLIDPLQESLWLAKTNERKQWISSWEAQGFAYWAERQYLPGVTDNLGKTIQEALQVCGLNNNIQVASGTGLLFVHNQQIGSTEAIEQYCRYRHFHPLTDSFMVHPLSTADQGKFLGFPHVHLPQPKAVQSIDLNLSDADLESLSRSRVLALSLTEMQTIAAYFGQEPVKKQRHALGLPQSPTDVELEIIAQTWSEHCKHKIFNATINYSNPSANQKQVIKSLYKTYIQAATKKLSEKRNDLLSVFEDNAGVVTWNDKWGVCFKVETHNSPSALEPYGGALTGILGVNRDILGTGLGAKPIFNTDVFCFAYPSANLPNRPTMLPATAIIQGVRKGVQDGGNKSGIPTVNGAVYFHPGYRAKPLVFCGTGGLLPLKVGRNSGYKKHTQIGDIIVMAGGRVGKDGIHGATFSSEALHEGSPVSAVQIGDPFTQKRLLDFILEARDADLITGITDNGAGGLSSSVGEMATITGGATLELDNIPLKYPGLSDYEIVISESQERMTISTRKLAELQKLADKHRVEITAVGKFHKQGFFEVTRQGKPVACLDLEFLHGGAPLMMLEAVWDKPDLKEAITDAPKDMGNSLLKLLSHPNICSREAIIRQYDHEVQGGSVVKPLMGPRQMGPCDAAVISPIPGDQAGLVVSNGLCAQLSEYDPYLMGVCAVDEAVRNAVCVGADPDTLSLLDNFCWPDPVASKSNPDGSRKLAQLVATCQGLYDACLAYEAPLISGKDSMKNDFDDSVIRLSIPPTLLVSAMGKISHIEKAVTMEFKRAGDLIYLLSAGSASLLGSLYAESQNWSANQLPAIDLAQSARLYRKLHEAINKSWVKSSHDLSEGGLAVSLAECIIGSGLGADVLSAKVLESLPEAGERLDIAMFAEGPARILVSIDAKKQSEWEKFWTGFSCIKLGAVTSNGHLRLLGQTACSNLDLNVEELTSAWTTPLPLEEDWTPND